MIPRTRVPPTQHLLQVGISSQYSNQQAGPYLRAHRFQVQPAGRPMQEPARTCTSCGRPAALRKKPCRAARGPCGQDRHREDFLALKYAKEHTQNRRRYWQAAKMKGIEHEPQAHSCFGRRASDKQTAQKQERNRDPLSATAMAHSPLAPSSAGGAGAAAAKKAAAGAAPPLSQPVTPPPPPPGAAAGVRRRRSCSGAGPPRLKRERDWSAPSARSCRHREWTRLDFVVHESAKPKIML
jgi:hypothetical protein